MLEWVKALHVISVIAWMAGMLYLPRLFVYHADAEKGSVQSETFKVMERRLYRAIMTPAMGATWIFGLVMLYLYGMGIFAMGWIWVKLLFVFALSGFHGFLGKNLRAFANDENARPAKFFRAINEVPTVMMIVIVIMVIVSHSRRIRFGLCLQWAHLMVYEKRATHPFAVRWAADCSAPLLPPFLSLSRPSP